MNSSKVRSGTGLYATWLSEDDYKYAARFARIIANLTI